MPTILVVDDSLVDRRLVGGLLERMPGMEVEYAGDGEEALQKIQNRRFDLVVTDLMMPHIDGLELVARIVSQYPLIPVILITGRGSEEVAVRALQAGAASYVPKSSLSDLLPETVESVLAMSREEGNLARLMGYMTRLKSSFVLENDPSLVPPLVNYLHRTIRSVGLCDETDGIRVCVALEEALSNAIYHGNLELASTLRDEDRDQYRELLEQRRCSAPFEQRRVYVEVEVGRDGGSFVIRDEGPGFDPSLVPDPTDPANLEKPSGRGLLLMKTFMDEVHFNSQGNEVTLIKRAPCHMVPSSNGQARRE